MNFATSDLHFFHKNIPTYCPDSRGDFNSIDHMNMTIVSNINSRVTDNDRLYILGDIGFGGDMGAIVEILKMINGEKVIVWGNHDDRLKKSDVFLNNKALMGVVETHELLREQHKIDGIKRSFTMCHFPLSSWADSRHGSIHIHGHLHSNQLTKLHPTKRRLDVGLDGNNLMPYSFEEIVKIVRVNERLDHHAETV